MKDNLLNTNRVEVLDELKTTTHFNLVNVIYVLVLDSTCPNLMIAYYLTISLIIVT